MIAFGSEVAKVDTATLNRQATRASALPTNRQIRGDPEIPKRDGKECRLYGRSRILLRYNVIPGYRYTERAAESPTTNDQKQSPITNNL